MSKSEITQVKAMDPVKLTSVADHIQGDMMEELLLGIGISVYRKALESGGIMQTYMGYSIYSEELYVDRDDYERALEIVELLEAGEEEDTWEEEDWSVDEDSEEVRRKARIKEMVTDIVRSFTRGVLILLFSWYILKMCMAIYLLINGIYNDRETDRETGKD